MAVTNEDKQREAYLAAEAAVRACDVTEMVSRAGVVWRPAQVTDELEGRGTIQIPALGMMVEVQWPELTFSAPHPLLQSFPWRLIALHYLAETAGGIPGTDWVSYRELPDGLFYSQTITREVEGPLARLYGAAPERFAAVGQGFGAERATIGDVSLILRPLPRVALLFALWTKDEEFPARVQVLYERTGAANLHLQDLRILADLLGGVFKRAAAT